MATTTKPALSARSWRGSVGLTKSDSDTLTLSGVNTYTGDTTISGGTLALSDGNDRLDTSSDIIIAGGTLDLGGHSQSTSACVYFEDNDGGIVQDGTLVLSLAANWGTLIIANCSGTIHADVTLVDYQDPIVVAILRPAWLQRA